MPRQFIVTWARDPHNYGGKPLLTLCVNGWVTLHHRGYYYVSTVSLLPCDHFYVPFPPSARSNQLITHYSWFEAVHLLHLLRWHWRALKCNIFTHSGCRKWELCSFYVNPFPARRRESSRHTSAWMSPPGFDCFINKDDAIWKAWNFTHILDRWDCTGKNVLRKVYFSWNCIWVKHCPLTQQTETCFSSISESLD